MKNVTKDDLWKAIIEDFFPDFLHYFFPKWTRLNVDFTQKFEFLDTELAELAPEFVQQKRVADKLVKVFTKNKSEVWMLIHIEVQDYSDKKFAERMFTYFYRIWDKYKKKIIALAIFTEKNQHFSPDEFLYEYEETILSYKFNIFKVLEKSELELNIPNNPFSIVMLTAKKALEKQNLSDDKQFIWKMDLVKNLKDKNYTNEQIRNLLHFIRSYVRFEDNKNDTELTKNIINTLNLPKNMGIQELLTTKLIEEIREESERKGEIKGEIKGKIEGKIEGIKKNLQKGKRTMEEIADIFDVTVDFVLDVQKTL